MEEEETDDGADSRGPQQSQVAMDSVDGQQSGVVVYFSNLSVHHVSILLSCMFCAWPFWDWRLTIINLAAISLQCFHFMGLRGAGCAEAGVLQASQRVWYGWPAKCSSRHFMLNQFGYLSKLASGSRVRHLNRASRGGWIKPLIPALSRTQREIILKLCMTKMCLT